MKNLLWPALGAVVVFLYVLLPSNLIPPLHDWAHRHEGLTMLLMFAPMPLAVLFGSFAVALTEGGMGLLLIRGSSPLSGTLRRCARFARTVPFIVLPPAAAAAVVFLLLLFVVRGAVLSVPASSDVERTALLFALRPINVAAYLAAGFLLLLSNAVLIRAFLDAAKGEVRPLAAVGAALRAALPLAGLALVLFGGMLAVQYLWEGARKWVRALFGLFGERMVEFALVLLENGALLGANLLVTVMLEERVGLLAAAARVRAIVRGEASDAARAAFGLAAVSYEGPMTLVFGCAGTAVLLSPLFVESGMPRFLLTWAAGFAVGALLASIVLALVSALQAVFAVGLYERAARGRILPGFEKEDFERVLREGAATAVRLSV